MKVKTSELQGAALDWAVAKCEGLKVYFEDGLVCLVGQPFDTYWKYWNPSADWAQGGPIIEREGVDLICYPVRGGFIWGARILWYPDERLGETPLIAAMRRYVASKLGGEVEIDDNLTGDAK